jgi:hypothetical protein
MYPSRPGWTGRSAIKKFLQIAISRCYVHIAVASLIRWCLKADTNIQGAPGKCRYQSHSPYTETTVFTKSEGPLAGRAKMSALGPPDHRRRTIEHRRLERQLFFWTVRQTLLCVVLLALTVYFVVSLIQGQSPSADLLLRDLGG